MPNVSGSPSQIVTWQPTVAALQGTPADQFKDGDMGFVTSRYGSDDGPLYVLMRQVDTATPLPAVNGTTVLSVFEQANDRWISLSILVGSGGLKVERFTALAAQTVFPLAGLVKGKTVLFINGVEYDEGVGLSYTLTEIAGVWTITWLNNPFVIQAGWTVTVYYEAGVV